MKVKTLNDIEYEFKIPEKRAKGHKRKCSNGHKSARKLLKQIYPNTRIYEEIPIKISEDKDLYLDFYIPVLRTAIEVHGAQHYEYNAHFFKSKLDWLKAQNNDKLKIEWCRYNDIDIIILPFNENEEQWKTRLL